MPLTLYLFIHFIYEKLSVSKSEILFFKKANHKSSLKCILRQG